MKATPNLAWHAMKDYYEKHKDSSLVNVDFNYKSLNSFVKDFTNMYKKILKNYMNSQDGDLDRHKQAAILLWCTQKHNLFRYNQVVDDDKIFVGCEQIGLLMSLSFMKDMLNNILVEIDEKPISQFVFPTAFSCDTEYFDILTRDIYLQNHTDDGVYVLFLSNIFFFIEYNTLKEIDPSLISKIKNYTVSKSQN